MEGSYGIVDLTSAENGVRLRGKRGQTLGFNFRGEDGGNPGKTVLDSANRSAFFAAAQAGWKEIRGE